MKQMLKCNQSPPSSPASFLLFSSLLTVTRSGDMNSQKIRRKPNNVTNDDDSDKPDFILLSSAISNGDDLTPLIRKSFSTNTPETLINHLRRFSRSKQSEIEQLCQAHYLDFISAVDELKSLISDAEELKSALYNSNVILHSVASPLLSVLEPFVEAETVSRNVGIGLDSVRACVQLMEICRRANEHLEKENFYMVLKCLDEIERELAGKKTFPSETIRRMVEKQSLVIRSYIEKKIGKEFRDWLVEVRVVSRKVGQVAIGQALAARQKEEEMRMKQREAEEQSRLSLRNCVYALDEEEVEEDDEDGGGERWSGGGGIDLTPLYRAYHVNQTLGFEERFRKYYFENRKLQLTSDFQVSSMTPFLESHQMFFAQIAGFFIVEDRILRTAGGLILKHEVDHLWEAAVSKMCSVLEDQFSRVRTANHLLMIKDYVSLLGVTLRRYGYHIDSLLDVLGKHREKYHELLLSDCQKLIGDALAADRFEQMVMRKEYEYSMNVLSFHIQTSDIIPAFPYIAPFSTMVPDCCRIIRSFIEDSVSFMSYGGQLEFYDVVRKYLDRLLSEVLDGALLKVIKSSVHGVPQAMKVAANMAVFERACEFLFHHAALLSGIPLRMAERSKLDFPMKKSRDAAEMMLSGMLKSKVDGFLSLIENVDWMSDETQPSGNEYVNEVIIYLETIVFTAEQILPPQVLKRPLQDVLSHISAKIVEALSKDSVKRFTINAFRGFDEDVRQLESFVDKQSHLFSDADLSQLKSALAESRQLINLLLSSHPEHFLNAVIRERNYNTLDYRKVVIISEKLRDPSERMFGSFSGRGIKQSSKNKSLESLIKRLKDAS